MTRYLYGIGSVLLLVAGPAHATGDWEGSYRDGESTHSLAAQVIPREGGQYDVVLRGGLYAGQPALATLTGTLEEGHLQVEGGESPRWQIRFSELRAEGSVGGAPGGLTLRKVVKSSPTLGAEPPAEALVLLGATTGLDAWRIDKSGPLTPAGWTQMPGGVIEIAPKSGSICTRQTFSDFQLHLEFRLPVMADKRGQSRSNSGVYTFGRYETQILDSYGEAPLINGCGALYKTKPPRINMCYPPGRWQTYDITFTAPRFDDRGKRLSKARFTTLHNGVKIHDDVELDKGTGAGGSKPEIPEGPIQLQDHGNPVQFRNIWLVEP